VVGHRDVGSRDDTRRLEDGKGGISDEVRSGLCGLDRANGGKAIDVTTRILTAVTILLGILGVSTGAAALAAAPANTQPAAGPHGKEQAKPVDDTAIKIKAAADVQRLRDALIEYTWGKEGWPSKKMPVVKKGVACPIKALTNVRRCDSLTVAVTINENSSTTTTAWHLSPKAEPNRRLVIFNPGHVMDYNDPAYPCDARTIDALLAKGFSVLAMLMPLDDVGRVCPHDRLFSFRFADGSAFKLFLEPVAACLNYLRTGSAEDSFPHYTEYDMVGLSGGGWTTTVYSAIDPSIKTSIPVSGTLPIYMRYDGSIGDAEQIWPAFYEIAGYPDLYIMGSYGQGRKQVQVLNRKDDGCFGEAQHRGPLAWDKTVRDYEERVASALAALNAAKHFRVYIDEAATRHEISVNAQDNVILRELGVPLAP
jgi:hypothetical protein